MKMVGLTLSQRIVAGLVADTKLIGPLQAFPPQEDEDGALIQMPREEIVRVMCEEIASIARGVDDIGAVGIALPGIVRNGVVDDSPNLPQMKGARVQEEISAALRQHNLNVPVKVMNDADSVAAGLAATQGKLDNIIRVWTVGTGIGFGRYPLDEGIREGGHTVVTLDDKETYCGCGGRGHIEGIMGHRAMRLRFLDMEPEEVFEKANKGDQRCHDFKRLWHKALAAGTASSIHMSGAGKFYLTGYNVRFVDLGMLLDYIQQMVRMSPLLGFSVETRPEDVATEVIGAAVLAQQAAG